MKIFLDFYARFCINFPVFLKRIAHCKTNEVFNWNKKKKKKIGRGCSDIFYNNCPK